MRSIIIIAGIVLAAMSSVVPSPSDQAPQDAAKDSFKLHELAIDRDSVAIVVIDAHNPFWKWMAGEEAPVMARMEQLFAFADWTQIPFIATFEHPADPMTSLPDRLQAVFPEHGKRMIKKRFNCCGESSFMKLLNDTKVRQVVIAGAETDVCVLQSVLGLLAAGKQVFVLEDCLFTNEVETRPALDRMYRAGAIPCTYKTFYFEVTRAVAGRDFKKEWRGRDKLRPAVRKVLTSPYRLPPRWSKDKRESDRRSNDTKESGK